MNQPLAPEPWYCKKCRLEEIGVSGICSKCGGKNERVSSIRSKGTLAMVLMSFIVVVGAGLMLLILFMGLFGPFNNKSYTEIDYIRLVAAFGIGVVLTLIGCAGIVAGWLQKRNGRYQIWLIFVIVFGAGLIFLFGMVFR